jgi:hypothetical protein
MTADGMFPFLAIIGDLLTTKNDHQKAIRVAQRTGRQRVSRAIARRAITP